MVFRVLKEAQLVSALMGGGVFFLIGSLQILLWGSDIKSSELAKKTVADGIAMLILGVTIVIFGLYLLIPLFAGVIIIVIIQLVHYIWQFYKSETGS